MEARSTRCLSNIIMLMVGKRGHGGQKAECGATRYPIAGTASGRCYWLPRKECPDAEMAEMAEVSAWPCSWWHGSTTGIALRDLGAAKAMMVDMSEVLHRLSLIRIPRLVMSCREWWGPKEKVGR
jgi:hypothetical protein